MAVYQNMNQFSQTPLKGEIAAIVNPSTISCQVDPNSANTLVAGDLVKLTQTAGNTILVDKAAASASKALGFVIYSPKVDKWTAGMALEIALTGSVIYLESASSISRGRSVEFVVSGSLVRATAGTNPPVGTALDQVVGAGQLLRVLVAIEPTESESSSSSCRSSSSSSSSSTSV